MRLGHTRRTHTLEPTAVRRVNPIDRRQNGCASVVVVFVCTDGRK